MFTVATARSRLVTFVIINNYFVIILITFVVTNKYFIVINSTFIATNIVRKAYLCGINVLGCCVVVIYTAAEMIPNELDADYTDERKT